MICSSSAQKHLKWTNSSPVPENGVKADEVGMTHRIATWGWTAETRQKGGDRRITPLEWFLPGAAHLGCAAAKDKACTLISCSSDLECGEAEHVLQHTNNVKMSRMKCQLSCIHVYMCVHKHNVQCHVFVLLKNSVEPFKHKLHHGPGSLRHASWEKPVLCVSGEYWNNSWSEGLCLELR